MKWRLWAIRLSAAIALHLGEVTPGADRHFDPQGQDAAKADEAREVTYLERSRHGDLTGIEHKFTAESFRVHVRNFVEASIAFSSVAGRSDKATKRFLAPIRRESSE